MLWGERGARQQEGPRAGGPPAGGPEAEGVNLALAHMSKRPREEDAEAPRLSAAELAQLLEGGGEIPALDAAGVKRLLLSLERCISANRAARIKHASEPLRYLDSEVALHSALQALQALAAAPEQYPALLASGSLPSLLDLLTHENTDIAAGVVALLAELMGEEEAGEDPAAAEGAARRALLAALHASGALELLCATAARLHVGAGPAPAAAAPTAAAADAAARDAEALAAVLELLQTCATLRPDLARAVCSLQPPVLLATLLARLQGGSGFDECKGCAAELLAVLVTPSSGGDLACARAIGAGAGAGSGSGAGAGGGAGRGSGIDALLEALAVYRKRDPRGAEEEELIGNLLDTLCTCLVRLQLAPSLIIPPLLCLWLSLLTPYFSHFPGLLSSLCLKTAPSFLPVRAASLCCG